MHLASSHRTRERLAAGPKNAFNGHQQALCNLPPAILLHVEIKGCDDLIELLLEQCLFGQELRGLDLQASLRLVREMETIGLAEALDWAVLNRQPFKRRSNVRRNSFGRRRGENGFNTSDDFRGIDRCLRACVVQFCKR
jgi:hypothetical protein